TVQDVNAGTPDPAELLRRLLRGRDGPLLHTERVPARPGRTVAWPEWVPEALRDALAKRGIAQPWQHQADAAELAHAGSNVIMSTGTASGKSLGYLLPVLSHLLADPRASALY